MFELVIYMSGIILMMIALAVRTPYQDIEPALVLSIFWPLSILVMLILTGLWAINWDIDIVGTNKWFGFRKATNPIVKGFAITVIKLEFQFWTRK